MDRTVSAFPEAPMRRWGWLTAHSAETTFPSKVLLMPNQMLGVPPPIPLPAPFLALLHVGPFNRAQDSVFQGIPAFPRAIQGLPSAFLVLPSLTPRCSPPRPPCPLPPVLASGSSPQTSWLLPSLVILTQDRGWSRDQTLFVLTVCFILFFY